MSAIIESDLNDIRVFLEVVDQGSFTAAGKKLDMPTSTVSRRISRLEAQLGARLLQRTTRKLSVTDAGRIYYQRSERALLALEEAQNAVTEMQATPKGLVRVTAPVEFQSLVPVVSDFLKKYPQVQVTLDLSNRYVDLVEEGFDLAIRAGELRDSSLVAKQLASAHFLLVASPEYLKQRGMPKKVEDLRKHECIVGSASAPHLTWRLCSKNKMVSIPVSGRMSANHLGAVLLAAEKGMGIARLPSAHCESGIAAGRLVEVLPNACPTMGKVSAVYPSREFMSPAVRALIDHLSEHLQAGLDPENSLG